MGVGGGLPKPLFAWPAVLFARVSRGVKWQCDWGSYIPVRGQRLNYQIIGDRVSWVNCYKLRLFSGRLGFWGPWYDNGVTRHCRTAGWPGSVVLGDWTPSSCHSMVSHFVEDLGDFFDSCEICPSIKLLDIQPSYNTLTKILIPFCALNPLLCNGKRYKAPHDHSSSIKGFDYHSPW